MAKVHFRTNVQIKSIIGKDLITDDNVAVLELVKNSFDANSKKVEVIFENIVQNDDDEIIMIPSSNTSKIIIKDTGIGMDLIDISDKWLNIAYSEKKEHSENFGRLVAGNKGVGRFSCDKLGEYLDIYSKKKDANYVHLFIDWKKFEVDNDKYLDIEDISLNVDEISPSDFENVTGFENFEHGTLLKISKCREIWTARKILSLKRQLEKLINPNQAFRQNNFDIEIKASEFIKEDINKAEYEKINGKIKNKIFEKLNFRTTSISSSISKNGETITTILQDRGREIFKLIEKNKFNLLKDIYIAVYYLNTYSKIYFSKQTGIRSVDFGSISLFINGFRIPPYGDEGDDWLGLEIRKGQGNKRYLGTREIVGRIEITDNNDQFKIISSRTGIVNNAPFLQLTKSSSPFGYFYKIFRRLERFVVEGIKWDSAKEKETVLEEKINKAGWSSSKEEYIENDLSRNKRILSVINKIIDARKDEVIELVINEDFISDILDEQAKKSKEELNNILAEIENKELNVEEVTSLLTILKSKTNDLDDFASTFSEFSENLPKAQLNKLSTLQQSFITKQSELIILESKLREVEQREKQAKEELELEREKNTYFRTSSRTISEDAKGLIHNIKITAKTINSNIDTLYEKILSGQIKEKEILTRLSVIKFNAEKAIKISQLITRSNFKTQADKQYCDIVKFIEQYIALYSDIYDTNSLHFEINTNSSSLERKLSILDLSLIFDDLISNSEKAKATQIQIDIHNPSKNALKIMFSDNGIGVEKKFEQKFDQLFELGVTTTDGSGIGLHSVRKALKEMGGNIQLLGNGKKLRGATFEINFQ